MRPWKWTFNPLITAAALAVLTVAAACDRTPPDDDVERLLKQRIEDAYDFSRPGVLQRMLSLYPSTGTVVSASGGRLTSTVDSLRHGITEFWENAGRNMQDARWQWGDVHVERLAADAAVLSATWSIPHIAPTGRPHVISGAWTAVFRRTDGEWRIVHEHLSAVE